MVQICLPWFDLRGFHCNVFGFNRRGKLKSKYIKSICISALELIVINTLVHLKSRRTGCEGKGADIFFMRLIEHMDCGKLIREPYIKQSFLFIYLLCPGWSSIMKDIFCIIKLLKNTRSNRKREREGGRESEILIRRWEHICFCQIAAGNIQSMLMRQLVLIKNEIALVQAM